MNRTRKKICVMIALIMAFTVVGTFAVPDKTFASNKGFEFQKIKYNQSTKIATVKFKQVKKIKQASYVKITYIYPNGNKIDSKKKIFLPKLGKSKTYSQKIKTKPKKAYLTVYTKSQHKLKTTNCFYF